MARITLGALIVIDVHGKLNVRNVITCEWCKSLLKCSVVAGNETELW